MATDWFVNGDTGHDTDYDGTSPTVDGGGVGPFATIQAAILAAEAEAGNHNIHIAAGTYNETANNRLVFTTNANGKEIALLGYGVVILACSNTANSIRCDQTAEAYVRVEDIQISPTATISTGLIYVTGVDCSVIARRVEFDCPDNAAFGALNVITGGGKDRIYWLEECQINVAGTSNGFMMYVRQAKSVTLKDCTTNVRQGLRFDDVDYVYDYDSEHTFSININHTAYRADSAFKVLHAQGVKIKRASGSTGDIRTFSYEREAWSEAVRLWGCEIEDCQRLVYIKEYVRHVSIRDNTFTNKTFATQAVIIGNATAGLSIDHPPETLEIDNNRIETTSVRLDGSQAILVNVGVNGGYIGNNQLNGDNTTLLVCGDYVTIYNNIIRANADPLTLRGASHCTVLHNTCYATHRSTLWLCYDNGANSGETSEVGAKHNIIRYNILVTESQENRFPLAINLDGFNTTGFEAETWDNAIDNNVYYNYDDERLIWRIDGTPDTSGTPDYKYPAGTGEIGLGSWDQGTGLRGFWRTHHDDRLMNDLNSVVADPQFTNVAAGDFTPRNQAIAAAGYIDAQGRPVLPGANLQRRDSAGMFRQKA